MREMSRFACNRNVVLLSTHMVNDFVIRKYRKLSDDLSHDGYDVVLLLNAEDGEEWDIPDDILCFTTNSDSINGLDYSLKDSIKGFNPICRYSKAALSYLNICQKQGCCAHSEVLITTCLYHGGYRIGDFGGVGEFVPPGYENKFYVPNLSVTNDGTMRYRPVYLREEIYRTGLHDKLFHPIKW